MGKHKPKLVKYPQIKLHLNLQLIYFSLNTYSTIVAARRRQKQSWLKLLKSDLETIAVLFLLALSFATAVAIFTPEPPAPDATQSQRIDS
ncbi:hypothetical protein NC981_09830 [Leptolyngbya sp. DQ-M1]|uniref:hypothetical protein n=1 Tax=Leptolyngbya sp. DQ-M1 TaxID=2933920 RepID=UPI003298E12F